jgi:hypothetical protein
MNNVECHNLAGLVQAKVHQGLKDMKFFLGNDDAGTEEVCLEVNSLYRAIENGDFKELDFGDRRWREASLTT